MAIVISSPAKAPRKNNCAYAVVAHALMRVSSSLDARRVHTLRASRGVATLHARVRAPRLSVRQCEVIFALILAFGDAGLRRRIGTVKRDIAGLGECGVARHVLEGMRLAGFHR